VTRHGERATPACAALPDPGERVRRYTTLRFPPRRHVPGGDRRPRRAPPERVPADWPAASWRRLEPWLYGVDLFNRFYFWEAHEAWESLWITAERETLAALALQGLIQIAAALLKVHAARPTSAFRLSAAGMAKLRHVAAAAPILFGLDLNDAAARFAAYFAPLAEGRLPPLDASVPVLRLGEPAST
jgi:Domain of unknown function (DUF309)